MTINVTAANDAPTAANNTVTTNEDTDHTFAVSEFGFADVEGASLDHITIATLPSNGTLLLNGSAVSAGDDIAAADITSLVFRPAANANGASYDSFTFTVNDGTDDSSSAYTMTVDVTAVNDAPTITLSTTPTLTEGSVSAGDTIHTFNIADEETAVGSLTLTLDDDTYYDVVNNGDGTATVTLNATGVSYLNAGNSLPEYTVTVTDGGSLTATATQTPTVSLVNDDPTIALNTTSTLTEGSVSAGDTVHTFNIADEETADGSLTLTLDDDTYYDVVNNGDGTATVTLNATGVAYLNAGNSLPEYTVTVTDGGSLTATATQTPTISLVNDAPTAANNTVTTNEDTDHTFTASEFGFADEDSGDSLDHVTIVTLPSNGTLLLNGSAVSAGDDIPAGSISSLVFRPVANANGSSYDSFTFTVNDGEADSSSTYTMTIDVTAVNDAPVADNETGAVNEDATLTVADGTTDLLYGDSDVDRSDTLTITTYSHSSATAVGGASASSGNGNSGTAGTDSVVGYYGTLTLAADGTYTYVADQSIADALDGSDTATDVFTYTVSDGNGGTDTATLTITITGVNDAPVAAADTDSVKITNTVTDLTNSEGSVLSNDSDEDEKALQLLLEEFSIVLIVHRS